MFSGEDPTKKSEPHHERKFTSKRRSSFYNRVHELDEEIDEVESDGEVTKAKGTLERSSG